jgi:diguanylate cyclase (GGDEF)-like protein/PAS domain S-box-containing protein
MAEDSAGLVSHMPAILAGLFALVCLLALAWAGWRLGLQRRSLHGIRQALARSESQARDANTQLDARKGVEQAFTELSTYMQGIDQHALVSVTDAEGRIVRVNDRFVQISGHSRVALQGQDHRLLSSGFHDSAFFGRMWDTIQRGEIWREVVCNRSREGALYWVDLAIVPLKDAAGAVVRFIAVGIDITAQRRHEEALHYRATHDALTELPNRALLLERVSRALARARRRQQLVVLLYVDLDRFKQINDSLGHGVGDEVLCEMARRLQDQARGGDTVARLGGDEFVLACEGMARADVEPFGARIHAALQVPVRLGGEPHVLGGSVGVAVFPDHGEDAETLLKRADIAMTQAKSQSERGVCIFSPEMQQAIDERLQMEARLREAIGRGELVLHYQPQVDFETGALVSLEALVRWDSPDYGFLTPGRFVGLAEETGLIAAVDSFVLKAACQQMQQWHARGHGWIRTAVNLAATKFSDPHFKAELRAAMAQFGIPAGVLELEVTESLAMRDPDAALERMHELKGLGILLAVDDFGTGYSNLGYLKRFPADRLKVDQSFVRGLLKSPQDQAIVAAVVRLAHNLNMRAIAEGVESEDEAILLYSLDVDEIQGYWMARPQPAEAVELLFDRPLLLDPAAFLRREASPAVLLVEDEEITRQLLEHLLQSLGVRVASAASAEQALQMFHQQEYALAIVDHWLPGSSGIALLAQIRTRMPSTVRVLMTVSNDPQVLRDAINIGGVAHFLAKPVDPAMLRKVVHDACWNTVARRQQSRAPR